MAANYVINQHPENHGITSVANGLAMRAAESDVERAAAALNEKLARYDLFWRYYDGDHPQVYTNKRLADIFREIDIHFSENWCSVVVDALDDRVTLSGVRVPGSKRAEKAMGDLWRELGLSIEADDCHLGAFVTGESFLVAWPDDEDRPDAYYNDPRLAHVFYRSDRPREKRLACKWWFDESAGVIRLTLYYADRLEYYRASTDGRNLMPDTKWVSDGSADNSYGIVPVYHFRSTRRLKSDLKDAVPIQIAINKLVNDLIVAAEYGAFKQRWVISQSDVLDNLKNSPNEIWGLPAGDGLGQETQVGEFGGSDLAAYIRGLDHFANALSAVTRTPKHFFFQAGGDLSGVSLQSMEGPLTKKADKRIQLFDVEWRSALAFLARLAGFGRLGPYDLELMWEPSNTVLPLVQAQLRSTNTGAGIPIVTQLRREGWSEKDLQQLEVDRRAERDASADNQNSGGMPNTRDAEVND